MNQSTQQTLAKFASTDTWHTNHETDIDRFNMFIIEAFKNNDKYISSEQLASTILDNSNPANREGFEETLSRLHRRYEEGMDLLNTYNQVQ